MDKQLSIGLRCLTPRKRSFKIILIIVVICAFLFSTSSLFEGITNITGLVNRNVMARGDDTNHGIPHHFPHFLEQTKNPCYFARHESDLFQGLLRPESLNKLERYRPNRNDGSAVTIKGTWSTSIENLRCLPYYFVLGWPKCGTSDLYAKMLVHSNILHPATKEPMWFNKIRFNKDEYIAVRILTRSLSSHAIDHIAHQMNSNQTAYVSDIVGDHSTHTIDMWTGHHGKTYRLKYSFAEPEPNIDASPLVTYSNAQLIKRLIPDVKLIILMRNPVERFYSLYKMHEATSPEDFHSGVVNGINWWRSCEREQVPLGECMYTNPKLTTYTPVNCSWHSRAISSARKSIYHLYLTEWLQVIPRQQFLFLQFEDYVSKEIDTINNVIFPFLGLPSLHEIGISQMTKKKRQHVITKDKNSLGKNINYNYRLPMLEKTRELLKDFYRPYNAKLAKLLNDSRYHWE